MKISLDLLKKPEIAKPDTALLLVHGGPGMDSSYFTGAFDELGANVSVYSYDQGHSRDVKNMKDLVSELLSAIETIKEKNVFIVGHSFGGALATEALKFYQPSKVKGLVLISAALSADWTQYFSDDNISHPKIKEIDESLVVLEKKLGSDAFYKQETLAYLDFYFPRHSREVGVTLLNQIKYSGTIRAHIANDYMKDFSLVEWLSQSSLPMCNIYGSEDLIITRRYASRFNEFVFQKHAYEIQKGGHFPFVEDRASVNTAISQFIYQVLKETT